MLYSNDRLFKSGTEGDGGEDDVLELLIHVLMHGLLSGLQPLDERDFCSLAFRDVERVLAHFNVSAGVPANALDKLRLDSLVKLAVLKGVFARVQHTNVLCEETVNFHIFRCHRACLSEHQVSNLTDFFDGFNIAD